MRQVTVRSKTLFITEASAKESIHAGVELVGCDLRVCSKIYPPAPDRVVNPGIPEHRISLHIANQDYLERRLDGEKLLFAPTGPGVFNFIPAYREVESLWLAEVELLSIYLPPALLERTAVESSDRVPQTIELIDRFIIHDPFLEQLAYAFKAELEGGNPTDHLYLESLQTVLAGHLLRHHCSVKIADTDMTGGLPKSKLRQVIDYIQSNLDREISLAQLARMAQVSTHHFGKLFKQSMGFTPHQYVLKCRVEQAKKLLAKKQLSFAQISQELGFCDQSHFINVFRRYTTLTPRQYRNNL
ncbi:helix-turn-helix transcriptional regulator [Scytonema tolypothrichoides VB-61278]|nr:helix-turn-helix transcriptional regulator [Scytonema tolypothrichoides VB-61278]